MHMQSACHAKPRNGARLRAALAIFFGKANAVHGNRLSGGATGQSSVPVRKRKRGRATYTITKIYYYNLQHTRYNPLWGLYNTLLHSRRHKRNGPRAPARSSTAPADTRVSRSPISHVRRVRVQRAAFTQGQAHSTHSDQCERSTYAWEKIVNCFRILLADHARR